MKRFKGTQGTLTIVSKPKKSDTYEDKNEYHGEFKIKNEKGEVFACINAYKFYGQTFRKSQANARLLVVAPEILEALQKSNEILLECLKVIKPPVYGLLDQVSKNKKLINKAL